MNKQNTQHNITRTENKQDTRRSFLKKLWVTLGVIAGVETIGVVTGFLFSDKKDEYKTITKKLIEIGTVDSFRINSVTPFRGGRFYLVRLDNAGFIAISIRCTHLGCSINWDEDKKHFICPCHASTFAMNGNVLAPPAPKALDYYPVIIENNMVKVDVGSIRNREKFNQDQLTFA